MKETLLVSSTLPHVRFCHAGLIKTQYLLYLDTRLINQIQIDISTREIPTTNHERTAVLVECLGGAVSQQFDLRPDHFGACIQGKTQTGVRADPEQNTMSLVEVY